MNTSRKTDFGLCQYAPFIVCNFVSSLGLHHDGPPVNKECRDDLYIMSEWRTRNTTSWWSHCSKSILNRLNLKNDTKCLQPPSAEAMREVAHLNEWKKDAQPGQLWDADQQCEVLLKDPSARKAAKPEDIHVRKAPFHPYRGVQVKEIITGGLYR